MKDWLWSQPVDGCTGQGSDEAAPASVKKRMGFNSITYSSSVMLYYTYVTFVDRVSLGLTVLSASWVLQQASPPEAHSSRSGAKPSPEPAAWWWEPPDAQHRRVSRSKISAP